MRNFPCTVIRFNLAHGLWTTMAWQSSQRENSYGVIKIPLTLDEGGLRVPFFMCTKNIIPILFLKLWSMVSLTAYSTSYDNLDSHHPFCQKVTIAKICWNLLRKIGIESINFIWTWYNVCKKILPFWEEPKILSDVN